VIQRALVLHRWDFQETSLLLDVFTEQNGRVRLIAKGAKRPKSPWRGLAQPFVPLKIEYKGRSDLKTLTLLEQDSQFNTRLNGNALYSGFYLNELLQRLLPNEAEAQELFQHYWSAIAALTESSYVEPALRRFEWQLLEHLGAAFDWHHDADTGQPLKELEYCYFVPDHGLVSAPRYKGDKAYAVSDIERIANWDINDEHRLKQLKWIMREALHVYLGDKPLRSRELFQQRRK
jgi:DNA repair protein RecO (recombination protein O)